VNEETVGRCVICGAPANVHCVFAREHDGGPTRQSFCFEHAPTEVGDELPKTAADEIAFLRAKIASLDARPMDDSLRAEIRRELEQLIARIEAGEGRLSDLA
jgi:hypothetical protein